MHGQARHAVDHAASAADRPSGRARDRPAQTWTQRPCASRPHRRNQCEPIDTNRFPLRPSAPRL